MESAVRGKKRGVKVLIGVASLLLPLCALELVLHVRGYDPRAEALEGRTRLVRASQAARRGYELVPGAKGPGWGTEVAVNAHGFRGPERELALEGRTRWIALGDSVTFGNDLAYEETWPAVLERELATRAATVDVLNLGLGGYDTGQELATLEALGLPFHPARVVLGFCVNDLGVVSMSMESAFDEDDRGKLLYASRLAQWWRVKSADRAAKRALAEQNREAEYARGFETEILPPEEWLAGRERFERLRAAVAAAPSAAQDLASRRIPPRWYASEARVGRFAWCLRELARLAQREGFAVSVLLIPYLEEDPQIEEGYELVAELARAQGFDVVDPRAAFRAHGLAELRIRAQDPVHPDAAGHALLARALLESLPRPSAGDTSPDRN
ncbi:MAG: SGNH/GDSL hydrolase family protein [Planctomycetota bacterium]